MDYIDYKISVYKSWEKDRYSHKNRLKEILLSPSNRIDNKPSIYQLTAPCMHKRENPIDDNPYRTQVYLKSIREINNKDISKPLREKIKRVDNLGYIPKNFKKPSLEHNIEDENWRMFKKLIKVRSNFSTKDWQKDFQSSKNYKRLISKPHLDKRNQLAAKKSLPKRTLMESYSVRSVLTS